MFECTSFKLHNVSRQVNYIMILYYNNLDERFNEIQLAM